MSSSIKSRSILIYGLDPLLSDTRRRILERVGFQVEVADHREDFEVSNSRFSYDLIVICHTVPGDEQRQIASMQSTLRPQVFQMTVLLPPDTFIEQVYQRLR